MAKTYTVGGIGVAFGSGKSMLAIFNSVGSGRVVRVYRAWTLNNQTAGVTGVTTTMELRRINSHSAGTAVTPTKHDTANETAPGTVLFAHGGTIGLTGDAAFRRWLWSNDEPAASAGTNDELECMVPLNCVWDSTGDADLEPIVLREGEGLSVYHSGTTAVGVLDTFIEYTLENT